MLVCGVARVSRGLIRSGACLSTSPFGQFSGEWQRGARRRPPFQIRAHTSVFGRFLSLRRARFCQRLENYPQLLSAGLLVASDSEKLGT